MRETNVANIDPGNAEQAASWDGGTGEFWATHADRFDDGVAAYHPRLLAAAAIGPADAVLDIGCGSGRLTRDAARAAAAGSALGVDLSARLLELARLRAAAEGVPNARFEHADAQVHAFDRRFDVAVSRHGVMFFGDPAAAFGNLARALLPGGRLAVLTWQPLRDNEFMRSFSAALGHGGAPPMPPTAPPFSLSDPERVRGLLTSAGFAGVRLDDLRERMYFGRDVEDAFAFVAAQHAGTLGTLGADARARAEDALRAGLAAHAGSAGVHYDSACWLVTATRA